MKIYKTKAFVRLAHKERIDDLKLCEAIDRAEKGLLDTSLGKFLIKQRVARPNEGQSGGYRTIVFHQQNHRAVFLHLFAKNDKGNLIPDELATYREFAKHLAELTVEQVNVLVGQGRWTEVQRDKL